MKIRAYKNLLEVFCYIVNKNLEDLDKTYWDLIFGTNLVYFTKYILCGYDKEKQLLYFKPTDSRYSKVVSVSELISEEMYLFIVGYLFCSIIGRKVNVILRDGYVFTHFYYANSLSDGFQLSIEVRRGIVSEDLVSFTRYISFTEFLSMIKRIELR